MTSYNHQAAANDETNHHIENSDQSTVAEGSSNNNVKNEVDSVTKHSHTIKKDDVSSIAEGCSNNIENDDYSTIESSSNVENDEHSVNESSNNIEDNDENSVENIVVTDDEEAVGEGEIPIEIDSFPFCGSDFQASVPLMDQYVNGLISRLSS
ncbi:5428_t:CDS:1 [Racocetra fulgida]|uniref:5428_t:CDS:1 n=1 Tax=Racocetra fulgida TaxID=60492 RepID=A0A9N9A592_9GLOM|nr:5428_t:CDS:1 [Racocetra fulgida]